MTIIGWIQISLYCAIVVGLIKPLGWYMTRVFNGERTFLSPVLRPLEAALYRAGGVDERREQHWLSYTVAMLFFHVGGFLILYALMRAQAMLPFNPAGQSAVAEDLSFNTAASTGNNGSAFAGISANTMFYNLTGAVAMLVGRFWMIIPAMAIAGSLAAKKTVPASAGTFPTTGSLFVGLLVGVIVIIGGLTFFPALSLGPIVEHLAMLAKMTF
jgi:K+-transporting ATPase A subunit